ncbi:MAG: FHA domain-containing protein [Victivallaceae bacterium]|nr:FHA domain-containing protein [Victivallaceae bacterium]
MAQTPKLVMLSEKLRGKSFDLDKDLLTVGRREPCDIVIKDPTLSSHHCDFIRNGDTFKIKDNDSTNGTRVNNVPLNPGDEIELKNFDVVQLGGVETLFECQDAATTADDTRGKTGIDLEHTEVNLSTMTLDNYSPFAREEKMLRERSKKMMWIGLSVVGAVVLVIIMIVLSKL